MPENGTWNVYLSGEIHSDWRERIADGVRAAGLDVNLLAPVTDHGASDDVGVDVNVAARVAEAAKGGEVLVSEAARGDLEGAEFSFGRTRRLRAAGTPRDLVVCPARPSG